MLRLTQIIGKCNIILLWTYGCDIPFLTDEMCPLPNVFKAKTCTVIFVEAEHPEVDGSYMCLQTPLLQFDVGMVTE